MENGCTGALKSQLMTALQDRETGFEAGEAFANLVVARQLLQVPHGWIRRRHTVRHPGDARDRSLGAFDARLRPAAGGYGLSRGGCFHSRSFEIGQPCFSFPARGSHGVKRGVELRKSVIDILEQRVEHGNLGLDVELALDSRGSEIIALVGHGNANRPVEFCQLAAKLLAARFDTMTLGQFAADVGSHVFRS